MLFLKQPLVQFHIVCKGQGNKETFPYSLGDILDIDGDALAEWNQ